MSHPFRHLSIQKCLCLSKSTFHISMLFHISNIVPSRNLSNFMRTMVHEVVLHAGAQALQCARAGIAELISSATTSEAAFVHRAADRTPAGSMFLEPKPPHHAWGSSGYFWPGRPAGRYRTYPLLPRSRACGRCCVACSFIFAILTCCHF